GAGAPPCLGVFSRIRDSPPAAAGGGGPTAGAPHAAAAAAADAETPTAPYVVVLKDSSSRVSALASTRALAAEAEASGGRVGTVFDTALNGFALRTTAARAAELAADPRVAAVEPDAVFRINDTEAQPLVQTPAPWSLDRLDQTGLPLDGSYTYPTKAEGVTAYIVDTGINTLHQEFGGRARWGANAVFTESATDCNGHGTHVAGTVGGATYGVAKGVSLVAVKVANCRGEATLSAIVGGIDWVVRDSLRSPGVPAVANMSLGGSYSFTLNRAVTRAIASGITFTVAAGNAGENACAGSPAGVPQAITVGATDADDRRASFSDYGSCVDLSAPGVAVTSAWKGSATALARASGTSMAAPHAAGVAALVLDEGLAAGGPRKTPAQVAETLVRSAVPDRITGLPAGTPNLLLHVPAAK
ncbi:S8 family peptidase, partial [Streptomyces sp. NPDC059443]|uniref:S8 family peptidase n=1 Tax=Streptomyces sp. NPDC059443 TaxID=3346831 RepID=UPI0036D07082